MRSQDLALVQGVERTRGTLTAWNNHPWRTLRPWTIGAVLVAFGLLGAVWVVATQATPDPTPLYLPGYNAPATLPDATGILFRNLLVLALHAFACVAGFIAGSSLPLEADRHSGAWRWIHERAGPLAIAFVSTATTFSLATQAYILGSTASTLAAQLHISSALLLVGLLPHAIPELTALFLPLAAWLIASRHGRWDELLAATFVTVAIALPVLVISAGIEVWVSPHLLHLLAGS
jgi:hypothetical protein